MNENEIIMDNLDVVEEAIELVPEKKAINFGKIGIVVLATGAVAALGYKCYMLIKAKKAKKAQEDDCDIVEADDFECDEKA